MIACFGLCFGAIGGEAKAQAMTSGSLTDAGNIELGGQAMRLLEQQVRDKQAAPRSNYSPPSIKANGGNLGSGSANFASGVYTGTFRRVTNPYRGNAYWSLYEGRYNAVTGVKNNGRVTNTQTKKEAQK